MCRLFSLILTFKLLCFENELFNNNKLFSANLKINMHFFHTVNYNNLLWNKTLPKIK